MSFEEKLSRLNEHYFFHEFVFSKNTFRPNPGKEFELADSILWLDDLMVIYQLKERDAPRDSTVEGEEQWFTRKVLRLGTRQIRDTLAYLDRYPHIELGNHRGHRFQLDRGRVATVQKVICYLADEKLPPKYRRRKHYRSRTAGVIHLIAASDYWGLVQTLLTPAELFEYLAFREELIDKWKNVVDSVPEHALAGQYLRGDADSRPGVEFIEYLETLDHRLDEWDMTGIIKKFPDRVTTDNQPTDYYFIVRELAKLKRKELREFKLRFQLSMEKCRENIFVRPYRMASPRTTCGFVFIPLEKEFVAHRRQLLLKNLTYACKYDLELSKCIGVSFAPEDGGWYSVEWCYIEFPWEYDNKLHERLRENSPFREVNTREIHRYDYRGDS